MELFSPINKPTKVKLDGEHKTISELRLVDPDQRMEWHSEKTLGQKTYFWAQRLLRQSAFLHQKSF
jgi:hypothetical protein